jgi:type IV pilus assembly protein PilC
VILKVREDVESGAALADAMKKHPETFDSLFSNMIAAGEAGGILDTILKRLAVYIEKSVKLKGTLKSAMILPGRGHRDRRHRPSGDLWKVIPTFAQAVCRPRRAAAACRRGSSSLQRHAVAYGWILRYLPGPAGMGAQELLRDRERRHHDRTPSC